VQAGYCAGRLFNGPTSRNPGMLHSRLLKYLDEVARLGSIRKASV
jgi:hypothetical protein